MPIKRVAYACKFKCGRNVLTSRKRMEEHEQRCFSNPSRRACQTCKHWETEIYDSRNDYGQLNAQYQYSCGACSHPDGPDGKQSDCKLWETREDPETREWLRGFEEAKRLPLLADTEEPCTE